MTRISVDPAALASSAGRLQALQREAAHAADGASGASRQLAAQIRAKASIEAQLGRVGRACAAQSAELGRHAAFLKYAEATYERSEHLVVERSHGLSGKSTSLADRLRRAFAGLWKGLMAGTLVLDTALWSRLLGGFSSAWGVFDNIVDASGRLLAWVFKHVKLAQLDSYLRTVGRAARNLPGLATKQQFWRLFLGKAAVWSMKVGRYAKGIAAIAFALTAYQEYKKTEGLPTWQRIGRSVVVATAVTVVSAVMMHYTIAFAGAAVLSGAAAWVAPVIVVGGITLTVAASAGTEWLVSEALDKVTGDPEQIRRDRAHSAVSTSSASTGSTSVNARTCTSARALPVAA